MGTSSSSSGASGTHSLIPSWISSPAGSEPPLLNIPNDASGQIPDNDNDADIAQQEANVAVAATAKPIDQPLTANQNRYASARSNFNSYLRSNDSTPRGRALRSALRNYVRSGGGGSKVLAHRMEASRIRAGSLYSTLNTIQQVGKNAALVQFSLSEYSDRPLAEVLSALSEVVFGENGKLFVNTEDDYIAKQAYTNTIVRICEEPEFSLENLTQDGVNLMTSIFISETITMRVIHDIGKRLFQFTPDIEKILDTEDNIRQIVEGLVCNRVMTRLNDGSPTHGAEVEKLMQGVYEIAFEAIEATIS